MSRQAGKGDSYRKVEPKKWAEGWERAFGHSQSAKRKRTFGAKKKRAKRS